MQPQPWQVTPPPPPSHHHIICRSFVGLFVDYLWIIADYLSLFVDCLLSLLAHIMGTHPILSSQRGASAEFQLRLEAPQHVGVGRPLPVPPPPRFSSHLRIQQARSRESSGPHPHGGGAPGDDLGQEQAMLDGDDLRPAAGRRVGGCTATEVARGHKRPASSFAPLPPCVAQNCG